MNEDQLKDKIEKIKSIAYHMQEFESWNNSYPELYEMIMLLCNLCNDAGEVSLMNIDQLRLKLNEILSGGPHE